RCGRCRGRGRCAAARRRGGVPHRRAAAHRPRPRHRPQRSLLVWIGQEVQAVPWRITATHPNRVRSTNCAQRLRRSEPSCTGFVITFDPRQLSTRKGELEQETLKPAFWDDQRRAAKVSAELARTQRRLDLFEHLESEAGELDGMLEMAADDPEWR